MSGETNNRRTLLTPEERASRHRESVRKYNEKQKAQGYPNRQHYEERLKLRECYMKIRVPLDIKEELSTILDSEGISLSQLFVRMFEAQYRGKADTKK